VIGFPQYIEVFKNNDIDGDALRITEREDLKDLIELAGHRIRILKARDTLFGLSA
jgi:hypothetical protein